MRAASFPLGRRMSSSSSSEDDAAEYGDIEANFALFCFGDVVELLGAGRDSSSELDSTVARRALMTAPGVGGVPGGEEALPAGDGDREEAIALSIEVKLSV